MRGRIVRPCSSRTYSRLPVDAMSEMRKVFVKPLPRPTTTTDPSSTNGAAVPTQTPQKSYPARIYSDDPNVPPVSSGHLQSRILNDLRKPLSPEQKVFLFLTGQQDPTKEHKAPLYVRKTAMFFVVLGGSVLLYYTLNVYLIWDHEREIKQLLSKRAMLRQQLQSLKNNIPMKA